MFAEARLTCSYPGGGRGGLGGFGEGDADGGHVRRQAHQVHDHADVAPHPRARGAPAEQVQLGRLHARRHRRAQEAQVEREVLLALDRSCVHTCIELLLYECFIILLLLGELELGICADKFCGFWRISYENGCECSVHDVK